MKMNDAIKTALTAIGKAQSDFAEYQGISKQAINNKMARGTWAGKDLLDVANMTGSKLLFEFPDGSKIVISETQEEA